VFDLTLFSAVRASRAAVPTRCRRRSDRQH
jgi:hypothetical protein